MDQGIRTYVLVDDERRNADAKAGEVVGDLVVVGLAGEGHAVFRRRHACGWRDMVGKPAVLVEIENLERVLSAYAADGCSVARQAYDESVVPVLALADTVVKVFNHHLTSSQVGGRVHRINRAAFGIDVAEVRKRALLKIVVEFICVHQVVHCVVLHILVHIGINDICLVVIFPGDVRLIQRLEDASSAVDTGDVRVPSGSLIRVVNHAAGGPCRCELSVWIGRAWVFSMVGIEEGKVFGQVGEHLGLLFTVCLDNEGAVARRCLVFVGLPLDESSHGRRIVLAGLPLLIDLITAKVRRLRKSDGPFINSRCSSKVMIGIAERNFILIRTCTDLHRFAPDRPVWIRVLVAVLNVA